MATFEEWNYQPSTPHLYDKSPHVILDKPISKKHSLSSAREESLEHLMNARIVKKELVYVIGLAPSIAKKEVLSKPEFMGQYGRITKIVVNTTKPYMPRKNAGICYSAYITYSSYKEASIAILALDQSIYEERLIRASFGTTKYCTFFLRGDKCNNPECLYLHEIHKAKDENSKDSFQEQQRNAYLSLHLDKVTLEEFANAMSKCKPKGKSEFPAPETIYRKRFGFLTGSTCSNIKKEKQRSEAVYKKKPEPIPVVSKKVNKFGIELEDTEGSIINVPEEIEELLKKHRKNTEIEDNLSEDDIEAFSFIKHTESLHPQKWVEEFIESIENSPKPAPKTRSICKYFSKGLFIFKELPRIPTPKKEQFYTLGGTIKGYKALDAVYEKEERISTLTKVVAEVLNEESEDEQIKKLKEHWAAQLRKNRAKDQLKEEASTSSSSHSRTATSERREDQTSKSGKENIVQSPYFAIVPREEKHDILLKGKKIFSQESPIIKDKDNNIKTTVKVTKKKYAAKKSRKQKNK